MSNPLVLTAVTALIIALSAFFVAIEFALLAAKRHRLEDAAATSRSARAALRSSAELTVVLAGSQLGITACTLALGAVTKPAVHDGLIPLLAGTGLPTVVADVAAFVLALIVVTFLHLVVGEMAPKSWAIAHPERSAILLAVPMRAFMTVFRPILLALNGMANWCLRRIGIEPVDEAHVGHDPQGLRQLVEHSARVGVLAVEESERLAGALELQSMVLGDLVRTGSRPTAVPADASVQDVRDAAVRSGHLRILVEDRSAAPDGVGYAGVVHVRDTLADPADAPIAPHVREVFTLAADTPVSRGLETMRQTRHQLALVTDDEGRARGVITLPDLLRTLFPDHSGRPRAAQRPSDAGHSVTSSA